MTPPSMLNYTGAAAGLGALGLVFGAMIAAMVADIGPKHTRRVSPVVAGAVGALVGVALGVFVAVMLYRGAWVDYRRKP